MAFAVVAGGMFASAFAAATSMSAANPIERALVERDAAIDRELAEIADAKTLRARTAAFRAAFSRRVGYDALDRSPRSAKVTGRRDYGDFRVEKLLFESAPGCFVTGLLYLPDETRFKPPYAAYLFSPGHSDAGKASEDYVASCALGARNGLAALAIDPIGQGERLQGANLETLHRKCAEEHSRIGHYAMLLGKTTMNYMLRDAAAALDVLASRPDIDSDRLAAAGCSGGATLTTFLSVVEPRLKAVAPCCYVSSARASLLACGPQDCEQNFHDWGSFGFNHAMMVLSNERPFLIAASEKDFFPLAGTLSTHALVTNLAVRCGLPADRFALNVVPGPHAIPKPSREAIVAFFLRHLKGVVTTVTEREAPKLTEEDCRVTPEGSVLKLPGARSIYAEIESELAKRGELFAKGVLKGAERVAMDPFAVNAERRGWRGYCILNGEAWAQECYLAGLVDPAKFDPRPFLPRLHGRARFSPTEFFVPSAPRTATETRYLDEMNLDTMGCGMRLRPVKNRSVRGTPMRLGSATNVVTRGVGTHVESAYVLEADGCVTAFDATVGVDWAANEYPKSWDTGHNWGGVVFRVYADGEIVADTGVIKPNAQPKTLHAELKGARTIVLEASDCGDWAGYRFGHADWANARFTCERGALLKPHSDKSLTAQLGILTPPEKPAPQINGAPFFGVRPGHQFIYRFPVSGARPMRFAASGLPAGATFDAQKGILTGRVSARGDHAILFTAENRHGKATRTFTLKVGDTISLTPPMGWNHWNIHGTGIRPEHVRAAADGMVRSGLADHGWSYVNIDDGWNRKPDPKVSDRAIAPPTRNPDGTIRPNDRFADMKGLADYVHALGLKIGLYSSPGTKTCGGFEGSYGHEEQDAKSYAEWGFDYLKHDWCSYGAIFGRETKGRAPTVDDYAKPYRTMTAALLKQDRDIIHAFCQYGMGDVQTWGRAAGAQVWRSHGDLKDAWMGVVKAVDSYGDTAWKYTGPGFWCDPDMLVVGYLNTDKGMHDSDLTPNEQYTHISLWCMLNAPLLLGCDLNRIDAFTRNLLVNDEILAVHQDALGRTARRTVHDAKTDVWMRPLADGSYALAVVNRFPFQRRIRVDFEEAGFRPVKKADCDACDGRNVFDVRDLWRQETLGVRDGAFTLDLPGHATAVYRLKRL